MGEGRILHARPRPRAAEVFHRHSAAERHWPPAYRPRPREYTAGHHRAVEADERLQHALASRDRSCGYLHATDGRTRPGQPGHLARQPWTRQIRRARVAVEGEIRPRDHRTAQTPRRLRRLDSAALHARRRPLT